MGFMWRQQDLGVEVGCGMPGSGKWHGEMKLAYPSYGERDLVTRWGSGGPRTAVGEAAGRGCLVPWPHCGQWSGGKPSANCVTTLHCCLPTCRHMALARERGLPRSQPRVQGPSAHLSSGSSVPSPACTNCDGQRLLQEGDCHNRSTAVSLFSC